MWNIDLSRPVRNGLNVLLILKIFRILFILIYSLCWVLDIGILSTTQTYDSTYFNDFIFFGLRHDILNRVIINTMSGSAWHFKHFISLAVKILDGAVEVFNWKMANFINFEADIEGDDEEIGEDND